jgi:hypothetical protein
MGAENAALAAVTKALDEAFVRYVNAGEVDRLVATCYAEDALVLPANAPLVRGRGQIASDRPTLHAHLARDALDAVASGATGAHLVPSCTRWGYAPREWLWGLAMLAWLLQLVVWAVGGDSWCARPGSTWTSVFVRLWFAIARGTLSTFGSWRFWLLTR